MSSELTGYILTLSLGFQLAAAILAVNLIWVTGRRFSWMLFALALSLMTVTHALSVFRFFFAKTGPVLDAVADGLIRLLVSVFLFGGIACLAPLFRSAQQSEQALRQSEERYRRMVDSAAEGIWLLDNYASTIFVNRRMAQMLGYSIEEMLGRSLFHFVDARFRAEAELSFKRHRLGVEEQFDFRFRRRDGTELWAIFSANLLVDEKGRFLGAMGVVTDITERLSFGRRQLRVAQHDPLTGLPNRTLLEDRLGQALAQARRYHSLVAILFIDLDHFKPVNDALGHQAGDAILKDVAAKLACRIRQIDTVARYGGDEFVVVLQNLADAEEAGHLAAAFVELLGQPFSVDGQTCVLGGSIGISLYPEDGEDGPTLIRHADLAMYRAKEEGGGGYRFSRQCA
jgi:diguanylate cyclase (GGDEF)-like protein/PAS domain S-box-containing protein